MMDMTLQFVGENMVANLPQGPLTVGPEKGANSPGELVLAAVVGCSAAVLKIILAKKRITYDDLTAAGTLLDNRELATPVMTGVTVLFSITNPSGEMDSLERAVEQAMKNCPIVQSLKNSLVIKESIEIIN